MVFGVLEVGTQNFSYRPNECDLITNILLGKSLHIYIELRIYNFLCLFAPKTVIFGLADVGHQNFLGRKIDFFDFSKIVSNHFLSMNMSWKCVLEALGASFWQFSSVYGCIITPCKNLNFSKNAIFMIFSDFSMLVVLDAKKHKNV